MTNVAPDPAPSESAPTMTGDGRDSISWAQAFVLDHVQRTPSQTLDESVWFEVIQKMDEVYTQLLDDEVELERKNAQLESSQQFIVSVLGAMSDILIVVDRWGQIEDVNAATLRLTGKRRSILQGQSLCDLCADAASRAAVMHALTALQPDSSAEHEFSLLDQQQNPVLITARCTPRLNNKGKVMGAVLVARPIGELKRTYQQLRAAHDELKQAQQQLIHAEKMASLGRLVAGVAHELNNPISFVLGNVYALKRYTERLTSYIESFHQYHATAVRGEPNDQLDNLRQQLRIDSILSDLVSLMEGTIEGARRTVDIVTDLKRFSAPERGDEASIDLNPLIERAVHWVSKGMVPNLQLHWQAGEPVVVHGSHSQLLQVFMNIIQNACDATAHLSTPALWISLTSNEHQVTIRFEDNGQGVNPEHIDQLFDPFFTTKPVGQGTGLGLSISYGIIQKHGGRISVAPRAQGAGTVFEINLPRHSVGELRSSS